MSITEGFTLAAVRAGEQFHIGIVTDDTEVLMTDLTELFGYQWGESIGGAIQVELPEGRRTVELLAWYSTTAPRVEIVQSIPGTVWEPTAGSGVHHIGYRVEDVAVASKVLAERDYAIEASGERADGTPSWTYHRGPDGPRVELVSTLLRPTMERYFATGRVRT